MLNLLYGGRQAMPFAVNWNGHVPRHADELFKSVTLWHHPSLLIHQQAMISEVSIMRSF